MILQDLFEGRMKDIDIEYQDFLRSRGRNAMTDKQFQAAYGMTRVEWAKKNREWTQQKERRPVTPDAHLFHEDTQDDRNARIIAGEIEDAMSQGNESLAQQKIQKLKQLGYYFDKQGRLQRMGMYEAEVAEGWPKPVSFTPDIITALTTQGYKGPYKLSQLKKWYKELNGFEGITADDDIMVQGNDIDYDGWVVPFGGKFLMGAEHMVGPASAKEILKLDEKQDACYNKVKSRYKVWPSAYASGALVQCRKKGAANWGNKTKK
jgi:hypothetical protein